MKENGELEKEDIAIGREEAEMYVLGKKEIICFVDPLFDVDKKFHIDTQSDEDTWFNIYGHYNPYEDILWLEGEISSMRDEPEYCFIYIPTKAESKILKELIEERIQEDYNQTPTDFCENYVDVLDCRQKMSG